MPSPSRRTLLVAAGGVVLAALAAVPAPRLIFRRSPSVAERLRGDVRHVAMVVEPNTGYVHAALEVWTGSDWDIEYWTSRGFFPTARIVTNDLLDQGSVSLAINGKSMAMSYVTHDLKKETWTLHVTTKEILHRVWAKPVVAAGPGGLGQHEISASAVAVSSNGTPTVAFTSKGALIETSITRPGEPHIEFPYAGDKGDARPSVAVARDGSVGIAFERRKAIMLASRPAAGPWSFVELAAHGVSPVIRAQGSGFAVAWAEGAGSTARIVVRMPDGTIEPIPAQATGSFEPVIALTDQGQPVAMWIDSQGVHRSDGTVYELVDRIRDACCPSIATGGKHIARAILQFQRGAGILRTVQLQIDGKSVPVPVSTR